MDSLDLARKIADVVVDKQGEDILILDLQGLTAFTDYFVICSTTSRRQLDAIKSATLEEMKKDADISLPKGIEGDGESGWVLVDYNGVILHIFSEEARAYYQLEELWSAGRVVARIQ